MCSNFSRLSSIENQLDSKTISNIQKWLDGSYDSATKEQIIKWIEQKKIEKKYFSIFL